MTKGKPRAKPDQSYVPAVYDERHCIHVKEDGLRCGAFRVQNKMLCALHDPETKQAVMADQRNYLDHKEWLDHEIKKPHNLTTTKGIVEFNSVLIQAVIHKKVDRAQANTIGYLMGTQLQAIRAMKEEKRPEQSIQELIGDGISIRVEMTKEERKAFLTAGSAAKMGQILEHVKEDGRIIDMKQQADGSFGASIEAKPRPSRDMKMPAKIIAEAMQDEGFDVTKGEVLECFGDFLGDDKETAPELIGLTDVYQTGNMPEGTYHEFDHSTVPHKSLPGVLESRYVCKHCGISVGNTSRWENLFCEKRMKKQ